MNWELILILTSIMLFAYWLNYIMGSPLADKPDDVDAKAILFAFPYWLARRRLKKYPDLLKSITQAEADQVKMTSDPIVRENLKADFSKDEFLKGRTVFTWERSLLCPICLHWWLTVLAGFEFVVFDMFNARADFFLAAFVYLLLHLIIRKIA